MIKINGTIPFPVECISMNTALQNLFTDRLGLETTEDVKEYLEEQALNDPDYVFNAPVPILSNLEYGDKVMEKVVEYTLIRLELETTELLEPGDKVVKKLFQKEEQFIQSVKSDIGEAALYELFELADYLQNDVLVDVCSLWIAQNEISGLSIDEFRKKFGIENDYTEDEEAELMKNIEWVKQYIDFDTGKQICDPTKLK